MNLVVKWSLTFWGLIIFAVCCAQLLSLVWLFVTPWTATHQASMSMDTLQAGILEWVAIPSSKESSQPRDWTHISNVSSSTGGFFTTRAIWEALHNVYVISKHHVVYLKCMQFSFVKNNQIWKKKNGKEMPDEILFSLIVSESVSGWVIS